MSSNHLLRPCGEYSFADRPKVIACASAKLQPAGRSCFWRRLSVRLSAENLESYWSEIDVTCWEYVPWWTLEAIGSWRHLTLTFDLESYFRIFSARAIPLQWLDLAAAFSIWGYIFRISRSWSSFKVMGLRSRSRQQKSRHAQVCVPTDTVYLLLIRH